MTPFACPIAWAPPGTLFLVLLDLSGLLGLRRHP